MILNDILQQYQVATAGWGDLLFPIARNVFFLLATLELIWAALRIVLHGESLAEDIAYMTKLLIGISFFYALLLNADTWIPAIINSFSQAGATVSHLPRLDPSGIMEQGMDIASRISANMGWWFMFKSPIATMVAGWSMIIVLIAFAVIAGHLLMALIESYIVISGGVLFLGFAGSSWTMLLTERYLAYALATGVKLFMLYGLMGVGTRLTSQWGMMLEQVGGFSPRIYLEVLGSSIIFAGVTWCIPRMAAGLMSGAVSLAFSDLVMAGAAAGSLGKGMATGAMSGMGLVRGGGEATIEAAKYAGDVAKSRGGGREGAFAGARAGAKALASETLRQQWSGALVGSDNSPKGSVADRMRQRRAEFQEKQAANASDGGKSSGDNSSTKSDRRSESGGNNTNTESQKNTA